MENQGRTNKLSPLALFVALMLLVFAIGLLTSCEKNDPEPVSFDIEDWAGRWDRTDSDHYLITVLPEGADAVVVTRYSDQIYDWNVSAFMDQERTTLYLTATLVSQFDYKHKYELKLKSKTVLSGKLEVLDEGEVTIINNNIKFTKHE
jgi:hypothetical protein